MKKLLLFALLLFSGSLAAQTVYPYPHGWCEKGGQGVVTQSLKSQGTYTLPSGSLVSGTGVQASYGQCRVTVYDTGAITKPTIYSSSSLGVLTNPFTANSDGSFVFYAASGCYDVVTDQASMPTAHTDTICLGVTSGPGSGTVTQVNPATDAGSFDLFTFGFANQTTTPLLSFNKTPVGPHAVYGNGTGASANPSFFNLATGDLPFTYSGNTLNLATIGSPFSGTGAVVCRDASGNLVTSGCSGVGVSSWNARTGAVLPQSGDYSVGDVTGAAPLASPTFTGIPAGPTAAPGTNTTQFATTAFVAASFAPLNSPSFTGVPLAPTAPVDTNTTQIATTAFVIAQPPRWPNIVTSSGTNSQLQGLLGSGAYIAPSGLGQNVANQIWIQPARPLQPANSVSNSGGSLINGHTLYVQVTYNSAAGESLPSSELAINLTSGGCASSACSVTITAPTLPSGYTSYTVYSSDSGGSGSGGEKQQTASNACVAITGNCIIQTAGVGAAPPTTDASHLVPSPIATGNAPNSYGSLFSKDTVGTYHPVLGLDTTTGLSMPAWASGGYGVPVFLSPFRYNDTTHTQQGNNAAISFNHTAGNYTNTGNQDRGLWVQNYVEDSGSHYGIAGIQVETGIRAGQNPTWTGSPDWEVTAVSGQMSDSHTGTNTGGSGFGLNGGRFIAYRESGAGATTASATNGYHGIFAQFQNNSSVAGASSFGAGGYFRAYSTAGANAMTGVGVYVAAPGSGRFSSFNAGLYIENFGDQATNVNDINILSAGSNGNPTQGVNFFGGNSWIANLVSNGAGTINVTGSLAPVAVASAQLTHAGRSAVSNIGTPGATTDAYQIVAVDAAGGITVGGAPVSTATANATLDGTNFNRVSIAAANQTRGFTCYYVYRTTAGGTPSTTGKIGQVCPVSTANSTTMSTLTFDDTGIAGDGSTPPSANTTGQVKAAGIIQGTNTVRVASDVTFNSDTALHTITGLTWNLDSSAKNYSFHCWLQYSQATAGAANNIGIQSATVAATNIAANGKAQINLSSGVTTDAEGPGVTTLSSTTATNVIAFTPVATATVFNITMDGTIEQPAYGGGNVINIMASTGAAADALTIKRGSYCSLNP